jgi:hypothetical protein
LAIPDAIAISVSSVRRASFVLRIVTTLFFLAAGLAVQAGAADWSVPEQQLARKIVAVSGQEPVFLTFQNRSSLGRRDSEIIQNGIRSALEMVGVRATKADRAACAITISLSENLNAYVWVAEIRRNGMEDAVVLVSLPRPKGANALRDSMPLSLVKIAIWTQDDPILDVAALEDGPTPAHIAVLSPDKVTMYRLQGGKWEAGDALPIAHARPWPMDLRGRLVPGKDHVLEAYLPGVICHSTTVPPLTMNCGESDDPWPLVSSGSGSKNGSAAPGADAAGNPAATIAPIRAIFASSRNYFTGALTPAVGRFASVPKFYSAAVLPQDQSVLWLFAATDGQVHVVDGSTDQIANVNWGSDLASVRTSCGAGWQVLATSSGQTDNDSVRAYEFPDRDPVTVSAAIEFPGAVTAIWTDARGDTAVVIAKNQVTGNYEAFRLEVACGQ